jgi:hypothetical protein
LPNDGSGYDSLSAVLIDIPDSLLGTSSTTLVSATTIYGGAKVAFGTGATCDGTVKFKKMIASANTGDCEVCGYAECDECPGGDGPDAGMRFAVSGLVTAHGSWCSCSTANGTFSVPSGRAIDGGPGPSVCSGWNRWLLCAGSFGLPDIYVNVGWQIAATVSGWKLTARVWVSGVAWSGGGAVYSAEFSMAQRCDQLSSAGLTFVELIPPSGTPAWYMCEGWSSLSVNATSY